MKIRAAKKKQNKKVKAANATTTKTFGAAMKKIRSGCDFAGLCTTCSLVSLKFKFSLGGGAFRASPCKSVWG